MVLHVRAGKGGRAPIVPLSPRLLAMLRALWQASLFRGTNREEQGGQDDIAATAERRMVGILPGRMCRGRDRDPRRGTASNGPSFIEAV